MRDYLDLNLYLPFIDIYILAILFIIYFYEIFRHNGKIFILLSLAFIIVNNAVDNLELSNNYIISLSLKTLILSLYIWLLSSSKIQKDSYVKYFILTLPLIISLCSFIINDHSIYNYYMLIYLGVYTGIVCRYKVFLSSNYKKFLSYYFVFLTLCFLTFVHFFLNCINIFKISKTELYCYWGIATFFIVNYLEQLYYIIEKRRSYKYNNLIINYIEFAKINFPNANWSELGVISLITFYILFIGLITADDSMYKYLPIFAKIYILPTANNLFKICSTITLSLAIIWILYIMIYISDNIKKILQKENRRLIQISFACIIDTLELLVKYSILAVTIICIIAYTFNLIEYNDKSDYFHLNSFKSLFFLSSMIFIAYFNFCLNIVGSNIIKLPFYCNFTKIDTGPYTAIVAIFFIVSMQVLSLFVKINLNSTFEGLNIEALNLILQLKFYILLIIPIILCIFNIAHYFAYLFYINRKDDPKYLLK